MAVRRVNLWIFGCLLTETLKNSGWVGGRNYPCSCALLRAGQVQILRQSSAPPGFPVGPWFQCTLHRGYSLEYSLWVLAWN